MCVCVLLTIFIQPLPQFQPSPPPLVIDPRSLAARRQKPPVEVPVAPLVGARVLCVRRSLPVQLEPELVQFGLEIKEILRRQILEPAHHPMVSFCHELGELGVAAGRSWHIRGGRGWERWFGPLRARFVRLLLWIDAFHHIGTDVASKACHKNYSAAAVDESARNYEPQRKMNRCIRKTPTCRYVLSST